MVAKLESQTFRYTAENKAVLPSGVEVTTGEIVVVDGKIKRINNANVVISKGTGDEEPKGFTFSLYSYDTNDERHSFDNVPGDVDGKSILVEFVDFVLADIG